MAMLVGADIQDVDEVQLSIQAFGDRYLRRIYTDAELEDCRSSAHQAQALASRFAAKEAVFKILSAGNPWASWKEVEVRDLGPGQLAIALSGAAAEQATRQGITTISLSLSQGGGTAMAVVVAEFDREQ
jgi:holo-[acyl-carrier protein] synthase